VYKADANAALRDYFTRQDAGTWVDPRMSRVPWNLGDGPVAV
jgi:hypothetical protein